MPNSTLLMIGMSGNFIEEWSRVTKQVGSQGIIHAHKTSPAELSSLLSRHRPAFVHFSGHGDPQGELVFEFGDRRMHVGKDELAGLFEALPGVGCVVFSCCHSDDCAKEVSRHVDVSIGFVGLVVAGGLELFCDIFYEALVHGSSVVQAFKSARSTLSIMGYTECERLVLHVREGVDAEKITFANPTASWAALPQMVPIPKGEFLMGSEDGDLNERPTQLVKVDAILVSATPITQAQYDAVRHMNPSCQKDDGSGELPVENVTWFDAIAFCNALSEKEGLRPLYRNGDIADLCGAAKGYRLLTEAEWEYACRAGSITRWYTGDSVGKVYEAAWVAGGSAAQPYRVGLKRANSWGLYDMHGNVYEWCQCPFRAYPWKPGLAAVNAARVIRGGSAWSSEVDARSAARKPLLAQKRAKTVGFRIARNLD